MWIRKDMGGGVRLPEDANHKMPQIADELVDPKIERSVTTSADNGGGEKNKVLYPGSTTSDALGALKCFKPSILDLGTFVQLLKTRSSYVYECVLLT
jgi:hypothetical protein